MKDREIRFKKKNLSAFKNFLKTRYERLTGELWVHSYPYHAFIDPSSICSLSCPTCPTGLENASKKSDQPIHYRKRTLMSLDLFNSLIDELGEYLFMVSLFNWGEPLMNKNLPDFVKKARARDIYTEIHTHLSLRLSDQAMEDLLLSGIDDIAVSIDGFSKETYQVYRQGGNFELVMDNLKRLTALRDKLGLSTNIIWNFLIFSFNEHEIDPARQFCENLGIFFNPRDAFIDLEKTPDWLPSYRKDEVNKKAADLPSLEEPGKSCAWHYYYSVMNSDGSVSPCCALWNQSYDFGTILAGTNRFADIWNNSLFTKARGLFSFKKMKRPSQIKIYCERCPSEGLKDLYSFDQQVWERFKEIFSGAQPMMEGAFRCLGNREEFINFYQVNYKTEINIDLLWRWTKRFFHKRHLS